MNIYCAYRFRELGYPEPARRDLVSNEDVACMAKMQRIHKFPVFGWIYVVTNANKNEKKQQ